jgi:hypothetical protein
MPMSSVQGHTLGVNALTQVGGTLRTEEEGAPNTKSKPTPQMVLQGAQPEMPQKPEGTDATPVPVSSPQAN